MSMRTYLIGAFKNAIRRTANTVIGGEVLRMIAEEYVVNEGAKAERVAAGALGSELPPVVVRGPFAGLRYPSHTAVGSSYWPKLLGSYECELAPTFETLIGRGYDLIVDIGAAEGYYAVGLARRLPSASIIAFEGNTLGQQLLRAMADMNGVSVRIEGWCDTAALRNLAPLFATGRTLLLCDAESAEYDLLDPASLPELAGCDLVVELHRRRSVPDPRAWITDRFQRTHNVSFVDSEARLTSMYPELMALPPSQRGAVLFERTDPFGWAVLSVSREPAPKSRSFATLP